MAKTIKTQKSKQPAKKANATRPNVVSFRITATQGKTLKAVFDRDSAVNVNSPNQLARKITCDYLAGRLVYSNPADKLQDLDSVGA